MKRLFVSVSRDARRPVRRVPLGGTNEQTAFRRIGRCDAACPGRQCGACRRSARQIRGRHHRRQAHRRPAIRRAVRAYRRVGEADRRQGQRDLQEEPFRSRQGDQVGHRVRQRQLVRCVEPFVVRAAISRRLHRPQCPAAEGRDRRLRAGQRQGIDAQRQIGDAATCAVRRVGALLPEEPLPGRCQEDGVQDEIRLRPWCRRIPGRK